MIYLLIFIILLIIIFLMPVHIKLETLKKKDDEVVVIKVKSLFGILKLKFEIPYINLLLKGRKPGIEYEAEIEAGEKGKLLDKKRKIFGINEFKVWYRNFQINRGLYNNAIKYIVSKTKIRDFSLELRIGVDDAFLAAILFGVVWTILGSIITVAKEFLNLSIDDIKVVPAFDKMVFNYGFNCIITFKVGHIIITGFKALPGLIKARKRRAALQN